MAKTKVMLVLENAEDMEFLQRVLTSLGFEVILMTKGADLSEQLIDHFPDIVFASTLGRNEQILSTLGKIKRARGKPRLVYIRQGTDTAPLSADQRKIIDGVLYTPIDPLRLIEVVASISHANISELKEKYKKLRQNPNDEKIKIRAHPSDKHDGREKTLIHDPQRKSHYDEICASLSQEPHVDMDANTLRERQRRQREELHEDPEYNKKRRNFVKKLFNMSQVKKNQ